MPHPLQTAEKVARANYRRIRSNIEDAFESTDEAYTPADVEADHEVAAAAQTMAMATEARSKAGLKDLEQKARSR